MIKINFIKSEIIPIKNNEYILKNHNFDPSKSSPPNDFINKLKKRLKCYDFISVSSDIKCNNLVNA